MLSGNSSAAAAVKDKTGIPVSTIAAHSTLAVSCLFLVENSFTLFPKALKSAKNGYSKIIAIYVAFSFFDRFLKFFITHTPRRIKKFHSTSTLYSVH